MKRRKLVIFLSVLAGMTIVTDQVLQHVFLTEGRFLGRRIAPFDPPVFFDQQELWVERLVSHVETGKPPALFFKFDPDLGWCPPPGTGREMSFDWSGSRMGFSELPREKTEGVTRVVAVGCSFTRGDEVGDTETWAAQLDRDADELEIANLGVGGYGIDQALLRLRRDGLKLEPDEVWLGLLPLATLRTQTMYRPALQRWSNAPAFKPRFELDEAGELVHLPLPAKSLDDVLELLTNQDRFLEAIGEHDRWIARSPAAWAPRGSSLLHRSGIARLVLTWSERGDRDPLEVLPDKSDGLYALIRELCRQTRRETEAAGARFRLLLFPGRVGVYQHLESGRGYWEDLTDELASEGMEVIDLTETLIEAGFAEGNSKWRPGHHYSPEGNRIVAEALRAAVME